jgi:hypothetical protein
VVKIATFAKPQTVSIQWKKTQQQHETVTKTDK